MGFKAGQKGKMLFESGVEVEGVLETRIERFGSYLILTFKHCTVRMGEEILFRPEWGTFDMACGESVTSVFGGAADRARYLQAMGGFKQRPGVPKNNLTSENKELNVLYARVRGIREQASLMGAKTGLLEVHENLEADFPNDWLLRMELLELNSSLRLKSPWESAARERLAKICTQAKDKAEMINRGLELL